jgi:hypothetical protein
MVDFTSTQAQAKELAPLVCQREAQAGATGAISLSTLPLLIANRVDRMYRQLVEIHAIVAAQLAECARSRWTDSTSCSVRARTSQPRPGAVPFMTRLAPINLCRQG